MVDQQTDPMPSEFTGLRQALFILRQLERGSKEDSIVEAMRCDAEVVQIWEQFLKDIGWLVKDEFNGEWRPTDVGRLELAERIANGQLHG